MNDTLQRERHIVLDGIFNLRDLGGYPCDGGSVRWRTLYRADGMNRLASHDIDHVRGLGIATIIDLRTAAEVALRGRVPVKAFGARYHHLPLLEEVWDATAYPRIDDVTSFLVDRYIDMLLEGAPSIARALAILAHPKAYPILFHCAAGKDRTGVLAAVVLSLLGVPVDLIEHDYALSRLAIDRLVEWANANAPQAADALATQPAAFLEAPPAAIVGLLDWVTAEYGTMRDFVAHAGVHDEIVDSLRSILIERGPENA